MSEPIQSISNGNYILQGTVATSAGIVGDGSTQNPLRADETVLWSGDKLLSSGTTFNFYEPLSAFERVQLYVVRGPEARFAKCNEFFTSGFNNLGLYVENSFLEGSKLWWDMAYISIDGTSASVITNTRKAVTTTVVDNGTGSPLTLNYAIGINRIANN